VVGGQLSVVSAHPQRHVILSEAEGSVLRG
jgi:hypothetical protein